ncbi:hypothetical protein CPC08DRAFT_817511 [Agrocybe pediades]|nr:hypothetical protein CPC08DRAFT_817511 [Agrocybe pediades]
MGREVVNANTVIGPFFVGFTFSLVLLGISATQWLYYHSHYSRDKLWLKLFVAALFVVNTFSSTMNVVYIYRKVIIFFGSEVELPKAEWYIAIEPALATVIILSCQCFFAKRVYGLTNNWLYSVLIVITGVASAAGGILDTQRLIQMKNFNHLIEARVRSHLSRSGSSLSWPKLGCDGPMARIRTRIKWNHCRRAYVVLVSAVHLQEFKQALTQQCGMVPIYTNSFQYHDRFPKNEMMIDRVLRVSTQTGLVMPTVSIISLILYLSSQETRLYLLFSLPLPKVMTTAVLCAINGRQGWNFKGYSNAPRNASILQPNLQVYVLNAGDRKPTPQPEVVVTVHQEQW